MLRPANRPADVWQPIVSGTDRAFDFMAKYGIKGDAGLSGWPGNGIGTMRSGARPTLPRDKTRGLRVTGPNTDIMQPES